MAWTSPRTFVAGEIITASILNAHLRDQLRYLKGLDGVPTIESGLTIDNTDGDERLLLPLLSTAECTTVLNAEGEFAFDETLHRLKFYDGTAVRMVVGTSDVDDTPVNGATTDPISSNWAYDFINTLTTQSDLPYATAAGVWARLAKGTANQFLQMNAGATAPQWTTGIVNCKILSHTRVLNAVNGDVGYTGYGFQPKALVIFAAGAYSGAISCGISDVNLAEMCIYLKNTNATGASGGSAASTTTIIYQSDDSPAGASAVVKTLDADGFTLTWTQIGSPGAVTTTFVVLALA